MSTLSPTAVELERIANDQAAQGVTPEWTPKKLDAKFQEKIYKTLKTYDGEFLLYIWYYDGEYDAERLNGERPVIVHGTTEVINGIKEIDGEGKSVFDTDTLIKYYTAPAAVYVNVIVRPSDKPITENADFKDAIQFLRDKRVVNEYNGNYDKIYVVHDDQITISKISSSGSKVINAIESETYTIKDTFDVQNVSDFSNLVQNQITITPDNLFASGQISMFSIVSNFGGGSPNISRFYRGRGQVPDISYNNNVPTGGSISFSQFRGSTSKITSFCNGTFTHLQARWEIFGDSLWTANINKEVQFNGYSGSNDSNPGIRFNMAMSGSCTVYMTGGSMIMGRPGEGGGGGGAGGAGGGGAGGNVAMHIASPIRIRNDDLVNRIKGAGGGGGGGGGGGNGGNGGQDGVIKCDGSWFCTGTQRVCYGGNNSGGSGGAGGAGGRGRGYVWNGSFWVDTASNGAMSGQGGNGGSGGSGRGGSGGTGGRGGDGGGWGSTGNTGSGGSRGNDGGGGSSGCPNGSGGNGGGNGGGGGGSAGKYTQDNAGSISYI